MKINTKKIELQLQHQYILLGIYSTLADHTLAWQLNSIFDNTLHRHIDSTANDYSVFSTDALSNPWRVVLILNKAKGQTLFPQFYPINYFLKIVGFQNDQLSAIIKQITDINSVIACVPLAKNNNAKLFKFLDVL